MPDALLEKLFLDQLKRVDQWLEERPEFSVLMVNYPELVAEPIRVGAAVNAFLGGGLDEAAMVREVEPALYRERR